MKLVRYGAKGAEKPGLIDAGGRLRDLSGEIEDFRPELMTFDLTDAPRGSIRPSLPAVGGQPAPRLAGRAHRTFHRRRAELRRPRGGIGHGRSRPSRCSSPRRRARVCGPDDDVIIPKGSKKLDWEVELAFVIGKRASYVSEADALGYVLGYMICNDVSERFWQLEGTGQWIKGKSAETFGPLGPWLVTPTRSATRRSSTCGST